MRAQNSNASTQFQSKKGMFLHGNDLVGHIFSFLEPIEWALSRISFTDLIEIEKHIHQVQQIQGPQEAILNRNIARRNQQGDFEIPVHQKLLQDKVIKKPPLLFSAPTKDQISSLANCLKKVRTEREESLEKILSNRKIGALIRRYWS